jgi:uncharacterized protein
MKILLSVAIAAILFYVLLCAVMYFAQGRLLYFPTPEVDHPGFRAFRLKCGDAIVKVWELHPNARSAVIYFGGNGEDVGANLPAFDAAFPDRAVYFVNYRGYGGSTGSPSEAALISDAETVYDWVAARHDRIIAMGRSLGTGVATALASLRPVAKLVLVTPFDSIANVAFDRYPWLPVRWLVKDSYDSARRVGGVRAPVLVLVAEHDESIPRARSKALIAAIPADDRHVVVIAGATHNDIETFPDYTSTLKAFLAQEAPSRPGVASSR